MWGLSDKMSEIPIKELERLELQIKKAYLTSSVIDEVCTIEPVHSDYHSGEFTQFVNRLLIEKEIILNPSNYISMSELGTSVSRNEINCIVKDTFEKCISKELEKIEYSDIVDAVLNLNANDYKPNHIFLPIEYFHKVIDWNAGKPLDFSKRSVTGQVFIDGYGAIPITYSNKYVPFENVIVTCKEANLWQYRPASESNDRLTVKFDWNLNDPINTILLVKTVFNFIPHKEGNVVLKPKKDDV